MHINRHNYEVFFLMYVDNELSATEKKEVDAFIEQNPDLREELQLLQQTILKPAAISFEDKISLLKNEVSVDEMGKSLLLLLDNEVDSDKKEMINTLIATNTLFANEWELLQHTKLHPDIAITFNDKNSLYKKTNEHVIDLNWLKIAVAAIFIGFGAWVIAPFFIEKDKTATTKAITLKSSTQQQIIFNKTILKGTNNIKSQPIYTKNITEKHTRKITKDIDPQQNNLITAIKNNDKKTPTGNSQKNYFDNNSNKEIVSNVPLKKMDDKIDIQKNDISANNKPEEKITNNRAITNLYANNASLKGNINETNDDNHILYMPEEKLQKTKVGGFFNKVKQAIKNKTKSGIHIANIEIAIR